MAARRGLPGHPVELAVGGGRRVVAEQHPVAQEGQGITGGLLLVGDVVPPRHRRGQRGDVAEYVGLLERHVAGQPGRGADVQVRLVVPGGPGSDRRRLEVRRADHDRDARGDAESGRRFRAQRAEDVRGGQQFRQPRLLDPGQPQQARVIADAVRVAVVGDPVQRDRVERRRQPAGETGVQPVLGFQERMGPAVGLRFLVLEPQDVCDGVLAASRRDPGRDAQPSHQLDYPVALHLQDTAGDAPRVRRAPRVHPDDRVADGLAVFVDGHRPRPLGGARHGGHRFRRDGPARHEAGRRLGDQVPPVPRVLLGAAPREQSRLVRLLLRRHHLAGRGHQGELQRRGAQVYAQDMACHRYTSKSMSRYPASTWWTTSAGRVPAMP